MAEAGCPVTAAGSRFRLSAPGGDAFGLWAPSADPEAGEEVWRVELPTADPGAVAEQTRAARAASAAVRDSERRLRAFAAAPGAGIPVAFAAPSAAPPTAEQQLALDLAALTGGAGPVPAFGIGSWFDGLSESAREAREFLTGAVRSLAVAARVETTIGGAPVARSVVGWTRSFETVWRAGSGRADADCHLGAVSAALATRRARLRLAGVLVVGAATVAAALATGAWVSVLPAVWRFVRRVLAEARRAGS